MSKKYVIATSIALFLLTSFSISLFAQTNVSGKISTNNTWHVSTSGSDSNSGSLNSPLRNISSAIRKLSDGDTILVKKGSYSDSLNFGTKLFVLKSESGADSTRLALLRIPGSPVRMNIRRQGYSDMGQNNQIYGFTFLGDGVSLIDNIVFAPKSAPYFFNCSFEKFGTVFNSFEFAQFQNCIFRENGSIEGDNTRPDVAGLGFIPSFINCTFDNNRRFNGVATLFSIVDVLLINCILNYNGPNVFYGNGSWLPYGLKIFNSLVNDTVYSKINGNSGIRPSYLTSTDYRLKPNSYGIGMGLNSYVYNNTTYIAPLFDFDRNPRPNPVGSRPDVGAFENASAYPTPNILLAEVGDKKITLNWSQIITPKLKSFKIYRSTSSIPENTTTGIIVDTIKVSSTSYVDSIGLTNLTKYYYRMKTVDSAGIESGMSNELSVKPNLPPAPVTNFIAEAGPNQIYLSWDTTAIKGLTYSIYRSFDSNINNAVILKKAHNRINYADTSVNKSVPKYNYWIKAIDSVGAASDVSIIRSAKVIPIWYVSTFGSDNNIGSEKSPLLSPNLAIQKAVNGDTVLFEDGTYSFNTELSGKAIYVKSRNGYSKTILKTFDNNKPIFNIISNWDPNSIPRPTFEGFTFSNSNNIFRITQRATAIINKCFFSQNEFPLSTYYGTYDVYNTVFANNRSVVYNDVADNLPMPKFYFTTIYGCRYFVNLSNPNITNYFYNSIIYKNKLSENPDGFYFNGKVSLTNVIFDGKDKDFDSSNIFRYDPLFTNASSSDFTLNNSSPAIGLGIKIDSIKNDILGNLRSNPVSSKPDLGAFENASAYPTPNLLLAEGGDKKTTLNWSQIITPKLKSFKIYRSTSSIPENTTTGIIVDTIKVTSTSYVDSIGLTNLTKYYYRMKTVDSADIESGMSNELSVKPNIPPAPVVNFKAEGGPKQIFLQWDTLSVKGTSYTIYRSIDSNYINSKILVKGLTRISYTDDSVSRTIPNYYYWIKAIDSVGAVSSLSQRTNAKVIPIWYVSLVGNDQNRGSINSPIKSITSAIYNLKSGDTILVNSGTYIENISSSEKLFSLRSIKGADSTIIIPLNPYDYHIRLNTNQSKINLGDTTNVLEINGFTFKGCTASSILTSQNCSPFIRNCIFKNNYNVSNSYGSAIFENCLITKNTRLTYVENSDSSFFNYGLTFINSTIINNSEFSTNIYSNTNNRKPLLINCIISGRELAGLNGPIILPLKIGSGFNIYNSIVDDPDYSKINGNDSLKLIFESPENLNFRTKKESAGIGFGVSELTINKKTFFAPKFDIDGKPRPNPIGSKPDVGAYENEKSSPVPVLGLIQKTSDTTIISWEYFDKSKISRILLFRDTTKVLDTTKAVKKYYLNIADISLIDTLPTNSAFKYFYAIKLELKDGSKSEISNIQAANGIVKTTSFIPPMVNARYAWGDIDSDGDMDLAVMGNANEIFLQIYKNNNGSFSEILDRNTAAQVYKGTIRFADIDNDGDIDLFVSGQKTTSTTNIGAFLFKNDGTGIFTQSEVTSVIATREGDAAFGDHDNDGDLDLALSGIDATGKSILKLFNNNGIGTFSQENRFFNYTSGPTNLSYADLGWVDYDNDGDQDLIFTGLTNIIYGGIIRNTLISDSTTTASGTQILFNDFSMKDANFDLADLNGDGNVDMVISGTGGTKIIYNQNIKTTSLNLGTISTLIDSVAGKVKLADYDNDGDVDILFAGTDKLANPRTIFYINSGDGRNFTKRTYGIIPNLDMAGFSWADYDNDKDLDLVISGQKPSSQGGNVISEIYSFETEKKNLPPNKPQNIALQDFGDGRILVKWDPGTDDLNPTGTLNYLVKIGSISLGGIVGKPFTVVESNKKGGNLLNPEAVLVYSNKYFTQLDPGKYYVLVQSVDNNKLTSVFSDTLYLTLTYPWKIVNQGGIVDGTIGGNSSFSAKWGDIDRDNDYDFVYGNTLYESNKVNYKPAIYQNEAATLLNSMINPNIKWNDLNQDGVPDMIISSSETISPINSTQEKFRLNIYLNDTSVTATDPITKQITGKGRLTKANISPEDSIYLGSSRFKISDINNDGKPDIMFAGLNKSSESRIHIFSTGPLPTDTSNSMKFRFNRLKTNLDSILLSQQSADLLFDFGDVDADNDNDFVAIYKNANGKNLAKVFLNAGLDSVSGKINFNESSRYSFEALDFATLDLIDYDKDGDLDLVTSGRSFNSGKQFIVYESKDSAFTRIQSNIGAFESGKVSFGDLNNDGFTDIIYSGTREGAGYISKVAIFDPIKKVFNEQLQFSFGDYHNLSIEFGDFDADNDLDILLYGKEKTTNKDLFRVYKNVQNESASVQQAIKLSGGKANLMKLNEVAISSRMNQIKMTDISTSSNGSLAIAADQFNENTSPSVPANPKENILRKIQNKYRVRFNWDASTDDKTPMSGLTYELRVGTKPGSSDVVVSSSKDNGYRLIPEEGNVGRNKTWEIDLPAGKYYWSVQAIDASLSGSAFASERQFTINSTGGICSVEIPTASIIGNKSAICLGDTTTLRSSVAGGIQWYKDDILISSATDTLLKVTIPGNYKVAKTAVGCSSGPSNVLSISQKTTPIAGTLSLVGSIPCEGGTIELTASSDSVIAWYKDNVLMNGITGKKYTASASGSYSIVSNSTNGCVSAKSTALPVTFKLIPKSIVTLSNKSICEGTKTTLSVQTGTNYVYQWAKDGVDISGATSATYSAGDSGIYKAKVTLDGCSTISGGDTLKVYTIPKSPTLFSSANTVCEGTKIDITSSTAHELRWYKDTTLISGFTGSVYSVTTSGSYSVNAVSNNCVSTKSNVIAITIKPIPKSVVTLSNKSICEGTKTTLAVQTGINYAYQWSKDGVDISGATSATYSAGDSGIYKAKVTLDGCSSISQGDTLKVYAIPSKPSLTRDNTELLSSSSTGNQWYLDGVLLPAANTQRYKPTASGSYTLKVIQNSCESFFSEAYYFLATGIINISNGQYIKLYPNPVTEQGNITIERMLNNSSKGINIEVVDMLGRVVLNKTLKPNETNISIPGAAGNYLIKIKWAGNNYRNFKIYKK